MARLPNGNLAMSKELGLLAAASGCQKHAGRRPIRRCKVGRRPRALLPAAAPARRVPARGAEVQPLGESLLQLTNNWCHEGEG